jgi:uncharacterized membrane protein YeaQ/YmgE (transglycosylase-associated protein family)
MSKDKIGIALSVGCMVHCIVMPLVLPLIPLIGLTMRHGFLFHIIIAAIIGIVAYFAFRSGLKKHGNSLPTLLGSTGVLLLFIGGALELLHLDGTALMTTVFGSMLLITAHYKNHKLSCSCEHHV